MPIEFSVDKRDIFFTLFEQLEMHKVLGRGAYADFDRDTYEMMLEAISKFSTEVLATINREGDEQGAQHEGDEVKMPASFKKAYKMFREAGYTALDHSADWGGGGFPITMGTVAKEIVTGANTSFSLLPLLNDGTSHLIEAFGTDEQKKTYCEKLYTGEWGGTMCLTEPQAGSDVGAAKTVAEPNGDHYLIRGTKIFITFGEHDMADNIVHAVLAKVPGGPEGTKGISLFVVPKYLVNPDGSLGERNDVSCGRIEHKMGIHASPTCVMNFGEEGKCKGWLLGGLHKGMLQMFQMMNEARLGVAVQGLAGASASYLSALGYALERKQGGHFRGGKNPASPRAEIVLHPDVRRMLMAMKSMTEGIRGLIYATALYADVTKLSTDEEERSLAQHMLELLIPVCKAYASDLGFRVCETAVQVYGGYGYTKDYPVEQYLRDTKIASIYEGTNGIQALDLFARKLGTKNGIRFKQFMNVMEEKMALFGEDHALAGLANKVREAQTQLAEVTTSLLSSAQQGDTLHGLLSACPYLEMFGNVACAFYLVDGARVAHDSLQALLDGQSFASDAQRQEFLRANSEAAFYHGRICSARFFVHHTLSKNAGFAASILANDTSAMDVVFPDEREIDLSVYQP